MNEGLSPWINEEKPSKKPAEPALKTNYKDPAKRYELAERVIWSKLADWKKKVIVQCKLKKSSDRILDEYAQDIIRLAESDDKMDKAEELPPVPAFTLESEIAADKAQSS